MSRLDIFIFQTRLREKIFLESRQRVFCGRLDVRVQRSYAQAGSQASSVQSGWDF